jgi:hypothetical protein
MRRVFYLKPDESYMNPARLQLDLCSGHHNPGCLSYFRNDIGVNQVFHQSISLQPVSLLRLRSTPSSGAISRNALKSIRSSPFTTDLSSIRIRSASKPPFLSSDATDLRSSRSYLGTLNSILASPFFDCLSRCLFTASLCAGVIFISPDIYPEIYPVIFETSNSGKEFQSFRQAGK